MINAHIFSPEIMDKHASRMATLFSIASSEAKSNVLDSFSAFMRRMDVPGHINDNAIVSLNEMVEHALHGRITSVKKSALELTTSIVESGHYVDQDTLKNYIQLSLQDDELRPKAAVLELYSGLNLTQTTDFLKEASFEDSMSVMKAISGHNYMRGLEGKLGAKQGLEFLEAAISKSADADKYDIWDLTEFVAGFVDAGIVSDKDTVISLAFDNVKRIHDAENVLRSGIENDIFADSVQILDWVDQLNVTSEDHDDCTGLYLLEAAIKKGVVKDQAVILKYIEEAFATDNHEGNSRGFMVALEAIKAGVIEGAEVASDILRKYMKTPAVESCEESRLYDLWYIETALEAGCFNDAERISQAVVTSIKNAGEFRDNNFDRRSRVMQLAESNGIKLRLEGADASNTVTEQYKELLLKNIHKNLDDLGYESISLAMDISHKAIKDGILTDSSEFKAILERCLNTRFKCDESSKRSLYSGMGSTISVAIEEGVLDQSSLFTEWLKIATPRPSKIDALYSQANALEQANKKGLIDFDLNGSAIQGAADREISAGLASLELKHF